MSSKIFAMIALLISFTTKADTSNKMILTLFDGSVLEHNIIDDNFQSTHPGLTQSERQYLLVCGLVLGQQICGRQLLSKQPSMPLNAEGVRSEFCKSRKNSQFVDIVKPESLQQISKILISYANYLNANKLDSVGGFLLTCSPSATCEVSNPLPLIRCP